MEFPFYTQELDIYFSREDYISVISCLKHLSHYKRYQAVSPSVAPVFIVAADDKKNLTDWDLLQTSSLVLCTLISLTVVQLHI